MAQPSNIVKLIKTLEERIAESTARLSDNNWITFSNSMNVNKLRETTFKDQHALANAYLAYATLVGNSTVPHIDQASAIEHTRRMKEELAGTGMGR